MKRQIAKLIVFGISLAIIFMVTAFQSYAAIDLKTCVGAWLFDEGKGDVAKDSSGNGNDGALNKNPEWVAGKFGKALKFDGTSTNVEVPDAPSLNPEQAMSMGCWLYLMGNAGQHRDIISKDGENAERQLLLTASDVNKFRAHVWTADGAARYFDGAIAVDLEKWYHVVQTYDGTTLTLYVDGAKDTSKDFGGNIIVTPQPLRIGGGANAGQPGYYTPGIIDEVVIFSVALGEADVRTLMNGMASSVTAVSSADKLTATWSSIKMHAR